MNALDEYAATIGVESTLKKSAETLDRRFGGGVEEEFSGESPRSIPQLSAAAPSRLR